MALTEQSRRAREVAGVTLKRVVIAVLVVWLLLGVVALVVFNAGDSKPGDGRGDRVEQTP